MNTVWQLMNSEGRTWKQLFKVILLLHIFRYRNLYQYLLQCLSLLEFLVKSGAERCIEEMRDHMRQLRALEEYNFYEENVDKGGGVREKATQLIQLLGNNETIREEREKARRLRDKFVGISNNGSSGGGSSGSKYGGYGNDSYSSGGGYSGSGSSRDSRGGDRYADRDSDRYSGGSSTSNTGRYNSRYGNDSCASRDKYSSNESSGYGGGGIDSDRFIASNNTAGTSKPRYGGGAYDTNNKSRYTDEASDPLDSHVSNKYDNNAESNSRDSYDEYNANKSKSSGKIKISIKNNTGSSAPRSEVQAPVAEVDLFADPTAPSGGHYQQQTHAPAAPIFDAFGGMHCVLY
jgi:hypothetical protein